MYNHIPIRNILTASKNIVVVSHINPDGDAIGSSLAWGRYLKRSGYHVTIIVPNDVPRFLKKIEGFSLVRIFDHAAEKEELKERIREADVICCLDFNEISGRLGELSTALLENTTAKTILIDHHLDPPTDFYDVMVSDTSASSTSYLIYKVIEALGDTDMLDEGMAEAIYAGMMTDTGNFAFGNLVPDTYRVVASLLEKGVDPVKMYNQIYNTQSAERMRLLGFVLFRKMHILKKKRTAYITLSREELLRFNHKQGDTEGIVNFPMSIEGIDFSAIFIETTECIKISLRSKGEHPVDVNRFARTWFTGGGHRNAAGAKSFTTMDEAVKRFLEGVDALEATSAPGK